MTTLSSPTNANGSGTETPPPQLLSLRFLLSMLCLAADGFTVVSMSIPAGSRFIPTSSAWLPATLACRCRLLSISSKVRFRPSLDGSSNEFKISPQILQGQSRAQSCIGLDR